MNTAVISLRMPWWRQALQTLWQREPRLVAFGLFWWLAMLPALFAMGLDERTLREVNVWVKPMKFMGAIGLLALTTAWFIGHLPAARRSTRPVRTIVWTLIVAGSLELLYITVQAALGQASHYNESTPVHGMLYTLMGIGAVVLTATQPALAWQLWRHGDRDLPPAYRLSVLAGLVLTFLLGVGSGMPLADMQPPAGAGMPLVGWSLTGGDLRVAHFIGIHSEQFLPAFAALVVALRLPAPRAWVWAAVAAWVALFVWAFGLAMQGLPPAAA